MKRAINFGKLLKKLRVESGMTQTQLAAHMNMSKSIISQYESQERSPSPDALIRLSAIFHVSTDYLLGIDKVKRIDVTGLSDKDIEIVSYLIDMMREKEQK